jgi:hypothetical protein
MERWRDGERTGEEPEKKNNTKRNLKTEKDQREGRKNNEGRIKTERGKH